MFLQFLDCAFQLCSQFPAAFEWGPRLPLFLAHHSTSGRFGSFLFNCERERRAAMLPLRTDSVWDFVLSSPGLFLSPLYRPALFGVGGTHPSILPSHPSPVLRQVRLWDDFFLRFSPVPSVSPMQGLAASLTGGGAAAARALVARADDVISGLADSLPLDELPSAAAASPSRQKQLAGGSAVPAGSQAGRSAALAAVRALAESGFATGAEDALATVLAAVLVNAGQVGANHRVASSADDEVAGSEPSPAKGPAAVSAPARAAGAGASPLPSAAAPPAATASAAAPRAAAAQQAVSGGAKAEDEDDVADADADAEAEAEADAESAPVADAVERPAAEDADADLMETPGDVAGPSPSDDLEADDAAFDDAVDGSLGDASMGDGGADADPVAALGGAVKAVAGGATEAAEAAAEALAATSEAEAAEEVSPSD